MCLSLRPKGECLLKMTIATKRKADDLDSNEQHYDDVDIDFDFFDIVQEDRDTIEFHLSRLLPDHDKLIDTVMEKKLGSVIKVDNEILGLISAVPLHSVPTSIVTKPEGSDDNTWFILYERLINMPWQTSVPMLKLLLEENELNKAHSFVLYSKCDTQMIQRKANKRAKCIYEYVHCEDEILFEGVVQKSIHFKKEERVYGLITRASLVSNVKKLESKL